MDKRQFNGGHSTAGKAGRKPKADEIKIIESLDASIDTGKVISKLKTLIEDGNLSAIKLYLEYRFGKPHQSIDQNITNDNTIPILNIDPLSEN